MRLGGYGYPTAFFVGPDANGSYTTNYRFGWRFFPRSIAREPQPSFVSAKSADTIRIFVLGSSAAYGIPDPSFNFGRILEVMLRKKYPGTKFEVVNAAITAINSHVVLEIARDCAAHQPDLFIVYMGNNEVVGPYGPGTVFQQWSPSLSFIRANIWVKSMRMGQLMGNIIGNIRSKTDTPPQWLGMEMFLKNKVPADDPRLAAVYDNFRQNLADICDLSRRTGSGIILSTVAVNLKDCPPFASIHRPDLESKDLEKWESIYKAGIELENKEQWTEAIAQYEAAARIDDRFADLQFRLGRCFFNMKQYADADRCFISARDLDALRFRADSRINEVIREVATKQKAAGVYFTDAEKALSNSDLSPHGIPGKELFYEHVHFTFEGNYLLARAMLDQVHDALPKAIRSGKIGEVPSQEQCAKALVLTQWDAYNMANQMAQMLSHPPFSNQLDHANLLITAREQAARLRILSQTPQARHDAWTAYESALREYPDDVDLHIRFAHLAVDFGQPEAAAEQMESIVQKLPWSSDMHMLFGNVLKRCGRNDEALAQYRKALEIAPVNEEAYFNIGVILAGLGQNEAALGNFQKAVEINSDAWEAHCNIGVILASRGQTDEGIAHFKKALEIKRDYAEAHFNLGFVLAKRGQSDEAIAHYRQALEIKPDYAEAHKLLGEVLMGLGRTQEALSHLVRAQQLTSKKSNDKKD